MSKYNYHIGEKFGKLEIIGVRCKRNSRTKVICECECGNIVEVFYYNLLSGVTKSCGCYHKERASQCASTHGMTKTRFYTIYYDLHRRCTKPYVQRYEYYGGRGIKCLWNSFEEFKEDMYESYLEHCEKYGESNTSIDRIDVDGDYCKENCRWATNLIQGNNTRRNHYITINGVTKTASEWVREYSIVDYHTFLDRINRFNWEPLKALTTPPRPIKHSK